MKDIIFKSRMSNRTIKMQYVAGDLGVAVAMPNNRYENLNIVATELSRMITEAK